MEKDDLEIISHQYIDGFSMFFNTLDYRTPHVHPEWELLWIMNGSMNIRSIQNEYHAEKNDLVILNPFQPHEFFRSQESCTFLCLQISPELYSMAYPQIDHIFADEVLLKEHFTAEDLQTIRKDLLNMMQIYLDQNPQYELQSVGYGAVLLGTVFQKLPYHLLSLEEIDARDRRNARLARLIQYVDENYSHKLRLQDFAEAEGCTLPYMSTFIKDAMNQTFQQYVTAVRFNAACKLLSAEAMKMQDVCLESGFSDYRYFARAFEERTGMTPDQYRKSPHDVVKESSDHRSLHSQEHFYTRRESLAMLKQYQTEFETAEKQ